MSLDWRSWALGVLSESQIKDLFTEGIITGLDPASGDIGGSSFDLHLSNEGWKLNVGCIKPIEANFNAKVLNKRSFAEKIECEGGEIKLDNGKTYVFRLKEQFVIPRGAPADRITGVATGRSTIGRVDVLVRLIADQMNKYDRVEFKKISGALYLEITPISFDVIVKEGIALSQLRLFYGESDWSKIHDKEVQYRKMVVSDKEDYRSLSVNLEPVKSKRNNTKASALKARTDCKRFKLWNDNGEKLEPLDYWELIEPHGSKINDNKSIILKSDQFYLLRSKELINLPDDVAIYCRAMDEALGEMRIHYAGFVHPNFGKDRSDGQEGTSLIFEVRGHNMDILLMDGEILAELFFYRMSKKSDRPSGYNEQELSLSDFFTEW